MARFGWLRVPDDLVDEACGLQLLRDYFSQDRDGYVYCGALFNSYPAEPWAGTAPPGAPDDITDSDLIALSMLGIRVRGYEVLIITRDQRDMIRGLLADIPPDARIDDEGSAGLLGRGGAAWTLREILRGVKDRTREARFGAVAAGKLLARKRPALIPIEDSKIAVVFSRKPPDRDESWWDDVRSAALDPREAASGTTLWRYLARLQDQAGLDHVPVRPIMCR
jgi:hypothetical protein